MNESERMTGKQSDASASKKREDAGPSHRMIKQNFVLWRRKLEESEKKGQTCESNMRGKKKREEKTQ
jgi:hypothetical protein